MSKFSLLTTLTLQAAGFNKGIAQASKGAKGLADGVKTAGNSMSKALSPITSQLSMMGGEFSGLATGAISAFKKMIPAINSVKAAFVASGIGAVILVISTAIAGLVGWMKRTDEGADTMRKAFDIVKAVINTVLTKISLLGSAIVKLFKGDFKGAAEDAKNAVTGWGEAIKEGVKSANLLNNAQDKLEAFQVDYLLRKEKINAKISELEYQSKLAQEDNTLSAQKKLDIVNKLYGAIEEGYQLDKQQKDLEIEVAKQKKAISADNEDTRQEYNDKVAEGVALEAKHNDELRAALRITKGLKGEAEKEVQNVKLAIEALSGLKPIELKIKPKIDTSGVDTKSLKKLDLDFVTPDVDLSADVWNQYKDGAITVFDVIRDQGLLAFDDIANKTVDLGNIITNGLTNAIFALGDAFGQLFAGAKTGFKDIVTIILQTTQQIIQAFLAEAIAATIAKKAATPWGLIGAAVGVSALLALWKSKVPEFHTGGIVVGIGEVPAILKPGEMILTAGQQKNLFDMINGGGVGGGNVVFEIQGDKLVGVLSNYNRRSNGYR